MSKHVSNEDHTDRPMPGSPQPQGDPNAEPRGGADEAPVTPYYNAGQGGPAADRQPDAPPEEPARPEAAPERTRELQERIRQLEEENSDLKDRLLRSLADFENFRKRMFREREEAVKYANSSLLSDLIEIIDDFERALQSAEASQDFDSFRAGVTMIERQLMSMLERNWGLKRFQSAGEEFDPEKHQAIALEAVSDHDKPVVLEDYQKGYRLHDRILRPAKVKVSQPAPQEVDHGTTTEQDES
jgi:molecular chaperone GrpE